MQATLLLLAAGMGSRYGGLKQLDAMGPSGQTMVDYAVQDAVRAGFSKVVFVIRKDFEDAFRTQVGEKHTDTIEVCYAFQDLNDLPGDYRAPEGRSKPWGTAHAVRAARDCIHEPFAVINADDFYGREAYAQMAAQLKATDPKQLSASMVGYILRNTLSPHGTVNRGICSLDGDNLQGVEEYTAIGHDADGELRGINLADERVSLSPEAVVSMNFWGFTPAIFEHLEAGFEAFLQARGHEEKSEYYLPSLVDSLIQEGAIRCPVLQTESPWFGVTYPDDKARVVASIQKLTDDGVY
ncbi:sugar phosphate nucleotidyltransferase [Coraliomargarita sp. SDUM461003]|uniref:Sugar phosphate nucleotidyltransferase n=1 Tax=Thalassobacterium maritimum TaxID=3041265 RepID=A0ABU1AQ13_9BACT|nr:sugar phosphate nucleotidyltransferase [Coraliomargarita sp. SDUM461003]MDQ8206264.1 sugar phosphate nucleotidyltransferase [Coraliomargarita sp. SDUM461003]